MSEKIIVKDLRSDKIYKKIMLAEKEKRDDIYRYDLMKPFEKKWDMYHCPLKAKYPGGYDVILAGSMLGYLLPEKIDKTFEYDIEKISDNKFWNKCRESIENSFMCFENKGIHIPIREYLFTVLLADPDSPYSKMNENYCGDGGIPGYIFGSLVPSDNTLSKLPVVLAHETNHNIRFQFIKWSMDISLGEYMVCEGLAENFAAYMYGSENIGPWVKKTDEETLNGYIKPLIKDSLDIKGFDNITAYMYGDEMALMRNFIPAGMPYCAGYACAYHLIKYYLEKTGQNITDATIKPAEEILNAAAEYWDIFTKI